MGDIADMVLEGVLCQYCGVVLDEETGFPSSCPSCEEEDETEEKKK